MSIQLIFAHELFIELQYRDPRIVLAAPIFAAVHIVHLDRQMARHDGQQIFNQLLTQMATLPAVYVKN